MGSRRTNTVYNLVAAQAARFPRMAAIVAPGQAPLTYGHLARQIQRLGTALHAAGIGRTDSVAVCLPHGAECTVATLGVAAYSIAVPIDPDQSPALLGTVIRQTGARVALVSARGESAARDAAYRLGTGVVEVDFEAPAVAGAIQPLTAADMISSIPIPANSEDIAIRVGASSGAPDPVFLTHGHISSVADRLRCSLGLSVDDRCLNLIPLWDPAASLTEVYATMLAGGCVVCPSSHHNDADFVDSFVECRPTWFTSDERIQGRLLALGNDHPRSFGTVDIRFVQSNGPDTSPHARADIERMFNTTVVDRRVEA